VLSKQERSLDEVWNWYTFQRALIGEEKARVFDALNRGKELTTDRYIGKAPEEIDELFAFQAAELEQLAMLDLLTCTEAALRVDFNVRVMTKKRDTVSRAFRAAYAKRKRKITKILLEEDILDVLKKQGANRALKRALAEFKGALKLRHWLAHGRFWNPKLGRTDYTAMEVFDICKDLLVAVSLTPVVT
jgi:hypothetical protein